ncbi:MAG: hypothetical protein LBQ81_07700 [Zoogloeaceae bacterium]|jgi:hypothetical protein|nr:hypothetical protein [Zoogloeaceae bacterium]
MKNLNGTAQPARCPVALALALFSVFPLNAAAQSQWGLAPATTVNATQINFAGHEWVVIGNEHKDIYTNDGAYGGGLTQPSGSVTLLLKSDGTANLEAGGGFGGVLPFRDNGNTCAGSYAGTCNTDPTEYNDSTLQNRMEEIANALPGKELGVINTRDLAPITGAYASNLADLNENDGINGAVVADQKLWALSYPEWEAVNDKGVRSYPSSWWLRSPDNIFDHLALAGRSGGDYYYYYFVDYPAFVVRPAFNLNLNPVLFTAESSRVAGAGKSAVTAGGGYQSAAQPTTGAMKFTFLDPGIATPTLTLKSTPLAFDFVGAPTGVNRYVSGFLYNSTSNAGFYAKYADTSSSSTGSFNAAGTFADGSYTLHIFSEEANGDLYSDFASPSVEFTFDVVSGSVQNLTLTTTGAARSIAD